MPPDVPGARVTQIEPGLLRRLAQGIGNLFSSRRAAPSVGANLTGAEQPAPAGAPNRPAQPSATPWMGPGQPIQPDVPPADVAGRSFDYPSGYNIGIRPRRYEGPTFEQLRSLSDNCDVLRLCIETVKDQMGTLTGSVKPMKPAMQPVRPPPDDRCAQMDQFFLRPDRRNGFQSWMRQLMEEALVTDAATIYVRRALNGSVYSLDLVDGATISPLIDSTGRAPEPPQPAYQQILKGIPAINYTTDELIYVPRNRRVGHLYGFPPVQQIIMTVNTALRRDATRLAYYTEGNVPEALVSTPPGWSPEVIERFQTIFDSMMNDPNYRRRMYFVPGDMRFQPTRSDAAMMDQFDEWLARIITYAFSLPPLPFVKQTNQHTAETSYEVARSEGMQPRMVWFKELIDYIIQKVFGYTDLEYVWDNIDDLDEVERLSLDIQRIRMGLKSIDDVRAESGDEPLGIGPFIVGIGPMGIMFLDDLKRLHAQGALMGVGAPPPDAGAAAAMGFGGGTSSGAPRGTTAIGDSPDPTEGPQAPTTAILGPFGSGAPGVPGAVGRLPPSLAAAVGLGVGGAPARRIDVTSAEEMASDPLANVVAHPTVLRTLREAERRQAQRRRA